MAIGATAVSAAVLVAVARASWGARWRRPIALLLALLIVGNELAYWWRQLAAGAWIFPRDLPLQLCDVVVFLMAWALCQPHRPRVTELAYCWGLAATSQALLTPDLTPVVSDYTYWKFFLTHGGVVVSAVYLAAGLGWRPTRGTVWRVFGVTNLYAAAIGVFNIACGANKLYLCAKPLRPSLLDWMGPWPWYILSMEILALVGFGLCVLPFIMADVARGDHRHSARR